MPVKLSKEQLDDLRKLHEELKHPKLKKLLKRVIKTWEISKACAGSFGVHQSNKKIKLDSFNSCCLIGAGIVDVSYAPWNAFFSAAWRVSGFSKKEFKIIWEVFDGYVGEIRNIYPDEELLISEVLQIVRICGLTKQ